MQRIGEMLGAQELRDALVGGVVDQDRAEQGLLGLEIVWRLAQARIFGAGQARDVRGVFQRLHHIVFAEDGRGITVQRIAAQAYPEFSEDTSYSAAMLSATFFRRSSVSM